VVLVVQGRVEPAVRVTPNVDVCSALGSCDVPRHYSTLFRRRRWKPFPHQRRHHSHSPETQVSGLHIAAISCPVLLTDRLLRPIPSSIR